MPAGVQKVEGQLPGPPAFWSAVLSSKIFWYSGVSGGGPASSRQLFGLPVRTHCPLRSGYFPKSTTWATHGVASIAAAIAMAQIELRYSMTHLLGIGRLARAAAAPSALIRLPHDTLFARDGGRWRTADGQCADGARRASGRARSRGGIPSAGS